MSNMFPPSPEDFLARFGLTAFRAGQREVIEAVLAGHDCLCIMPTGGGKSLCYQLPAVAREGLAIVVSPLIALMKDQVDALTRIGVRATYVNSSLEPSEQSARIRSMAVGDYDLVYVAPERFRDPRFIEALTAQRVQLLAVDEAHCISEWGHDFRPDYARLGAIRKRLGEPQTIALTATATPHVRQDVMAQLRLREPKVFVTGFARPNLAFEVQTQHGQVEKDAALRQFLEANAGAGIIYAATRKKCEELAASISNYDERTPAVYHAGLMPDDRRRVQESFMSGRAPIIVATNAFGMGIDKADLRFVVHFNMPGSVEAYYQEAGRAGRDGQPSKCLLLYSFADRRIQEFFIENAFPTEETIQAVYEFLQAQEVDPIELTQEEIKESLGLSVGNEAIGASEQILEKCGALERLDLRQNMASVRIDNGLPTLVDLLPKEAKVRRRALQAVEQRVGGRRGERVFFQLRDVADAAELDREAFNRAIRELSQLPGFDYIPPFRGRAVHVLDRSRAFEELPIDWEKHDARRADEIAKLDRIEGYAKTKTCRQKAILEYFGDPSAHRCNQCDNCQGPGAAKGAGNRSTSAANGNLSPGVLQAVRIALSGVARANGRFGKQMIAQMLCGSGSSKVRKVRLDKLSTFGLLKHLTQDEAIELIEGLLTAGLLEQTEETRFRPVLGITEAGNEVMRAQTPLPGTVRFSSSLTARLAVTPVPRDVEVTRSEPSPAEQAAQLVRTPAPPPRVEAVKPEPPKPVSATTQPPTALPASPAKPDYLWTCRLFEKGYSLAECAEIRRLSELEILKQLVAAGEAGHAVPAEWALTPPQCVQVAQLLGSSKHAPLPERLANLPPGVSMEQVRIFLQWRAEQSSRR